MYSSNDDSYKKRIDTLKKMIQESSNTVFFGGAGVSTESGVKDFRSKDGLYATVKEYSVPAETILSHSFFVKNPETFYDFDYNYFLKDSPRQTTHTLRLQSSKKKAGSRPLLRKISMSFIRLPAAKM